MESLLVLSILIITAPNIWPERFGAIVDYLQYLFNADTVDDIEIDDSEIDDSEIDAHGITLAAVEEKDGGHTPVYAIPEKKTFRVTNSDGRNMLAWEVGPKVIEQLRKKGKRRMVTALNRKDTDFQQPIPLTVNKSDSDKDIKHRYLTKKACRDAGISDRDISAMVANKTEPDYIRQSTLKSAQGQPLALISEGLFREFHPNVQLLGITIFYDKNGDIFN